jgi:hypothetical protein
MFKSIRNWLNEMRIVRSWRGNGSATNGLAPERWAASTGGTMTTSTCADNDLLICELQHRVDELLRDNDSLQERLWALNVAIISMAEKIAELEDET